MPIYRKSGFAALAIMAFPVVAQPQAEENRIAIASQRIPNDIRKNLAAAQSDAGKTVLAQLDRIARLDDSGPQLNAVIALVRDAPAKAMAAQNSGRPLAGRSVLIKDNIETRDLPTTAGSLALANNHTGRDAHLITLLRRAGGVVMGKTNLSQWANFRSSNSFSGWSAIGGITRNPHAIDRNACGSSSGSAAAVAAGFSWGAIGTETDGSITCPASLNGIVGFKPTLGLVSRTHIVPLAHSQDTAGPMARTVADAALLLNAISGSDAKDAATQQADAHKTDFTAGLAQASPGGLRIGILKEQIGDDLAVRILFTQAVQDLADAGAQLIEVNYTFPDGMWQGEYGTLLFEFREGIDHYLAASPADIPVRNLAELIAFNRDNAAVELRWFGQDIFETAATTTDRQAYENARASSLLLAGEQGIDRLLAEHDLDILIAPTTGPAWPTDPVNGDHFNDTIGAGSLAAIAGYPHLSVPMGAVEGLPVGLSIMGPKWADHLVLKAGAAYENVRSAQIPQPSFERWKTPEH